MLLVFPHLFTVKTIQTPDQRSLTFFSVFFSNNLRVRYFFAWQERGRGGLIPNAHYA